MFVLFFKVKWEGEKLRDVFDECGNMNINLFFELILGKKRKLLSCVFDGGLENDVYDRRWIVYERIWINKDERFAERFMSLNLLSLREKSRN